MAVAQRCACVLKFRRLFFLSPGIVILMFDTQMEPAVARDMIKGAADPLMSAFSLRYSQLLQLARTEGSSPEMMLRVRRT